MSLNRDREIACIAKEEVSPKHYQKFTPITRGPLFALLNLFMLSLLALPYLLYRVIFKARQ